MSGTLFVVATPIGNLEDITLRALRVLREADVIAAEDTRHTSGLLRHHGIATPTLSFHEHNTRMRIPQLVHRLLGGARIALVTDAGMPGISDPGVELVQACIEAGIAIDPIPGASAPLTAAVASGFPLDPITVYGFPPARSRNRTDWFLAIATISHTITLFEAPHRVIATLAELSKVLGNRPMCAGRELTKTHQQFLRGTAQSIAEQLGAPRGEFTLVIGPVATSLVDNDLEYSDAKAAAEFWQLTKRGDIGRRDAIAAVARKFGRSTREVYAAVERVKNESA
jgi:16S rRNA (cytidine1402-2'-O)-methyltransferase